MSSTPYEGALVRAEANTWVRGVVRVAPLALVLVMATAVRAWNLNAIGYNSDEAVYVGQGAALARVDGLQDLFPAFRAHPLLVQTLVALILRITTDDLFPRLLSVAFGVATVLLTYRIGRTLWGETAGTIAGLFMALMPYHVIVTRQILLDGPMTFFLTAALYCLVQYSRTQSTRWFYATALSCGLAFLAKETAIVMLGPVYAYMALSPRLKISVRSVATFLGIYALAIAPFPLSTLIAGRTESGTDFLTWQILRRPNHTWDFYLENVPGAVGVLVLIAAAVGVVGLIRHRRAQPAWPGLLLLCWTVVPVVFFQLWQVKGFQYLLPVTPAVALLAGRGIVEIELATLLRSENVRRALAAGVATVIALTLVFSSIQRISDAGYSGLAGSGGVPGGRETGEWIHENTPLGARFMTIGPSMANIVQFYGRREAQGLAVSPNPLRRNPSYDPIHNPDNALRSGDIIYVVWDAYSANRSQHFSEKIIQYADKYDGHVVFQVLAEREGPGGIQAGEPLIVVYEVRP